MIKKMQPDFIRLANNFYNSKGLESRAERIALDEEMFKYISEQKKPKKFKVAFVFICLNPLYWEFAPEMVRGAKKFFLPGHKTDFLFWTDIPEKPEDIRSRMTDEFRGVLQGLGANPMDANLLFNDVTIKGKNMNLSNIMDDVIGLRKMKGVKVFPTDPILWPGPTLLRYHLFLQQEELLKKYDYIFYCDTDMKFVDIVGDEILGSGLTAAPHPGYYLRKEYYPPYEPNEMSACFIPRPGRVVSEPNSISTTKQRFQPEYYAGGFQGGKSAQFIEAMKRMKDMIEQDRKIGYTPVWNDESAWNKELFQNPPSVMLDPSYIYPDSLIDEYYVKIWGRNFQPKLVTLTKWFSLSPEGGQHLQQMLQK